MLVSFDQRSVFTYAFYGSLVPLGFLAAYCGEGGFTGGTGFLALLIAAASMSFSLFA